MSERPTQASLSASQIRMSDSPAGRLPPGSVPDADTTHRPSALNRYCAPGAECSPRIVRAGESVVRSQATTVLSMMRAANTSCPPGAMHNCLIYRSPLGLARWRSDQTTRTPVLR